MNDGNLQADWVGKATEDEGRKHAYCFCDVCGEVIYEGDEYYKLGEDNICKQCVENAERIARR